MNTIFYTEAAVCKASSDGQHIEVDRPAKIYESPDGGKTVYVRDFGADPSTRTFVQTSVQKQWKITYSSEN